MLGFFCSLNNAAPLVRAAAFCVQHKPYTVTHTGRHKHSQLSFTVALLFIYNVDFLHCKTCGSGLPRVSDLNSDLRGRVAMFPRQQKRFCVWRGVWGLWGSNWDNGNLIKDGLTNCVELCVLCDGLPNPSRFGESAPFHFEVCDYGIGWLGVII